MKEKTPGIEFAAHLMDEMGREGKSLYLLGAKPGVAEAAAQRLQEQHPGLRIAGTHDGYFKEDGPVVEAIAASGADVRVRLPGRSQAGAVDGEERTGHRRQDCCAVWAAAWTCSPAWWSGRPSSGPTMGWSGSTGCFTIPAASAG